MPISNKKKYCYIKFNCPNYEFSWNGCINEIIASYAKLKKTFCIISNIEKLLVVIFNAFVRLWDKKCTFFIFYKTKSAQILNFVGMDSLMKSLLF